MSASTAGAASMGVYRDTVRNWLRSSAFSQAPPLPPLANSCTEMHKPALSAKRSHDPAPPNRVPARPALPVRQR
jgi:hypothetical protein